MRRYRYTARSAAGEPLRGALAAADAASAVAALQARALFVTGLRPLRGWNRELALPGLAGPSRHARVTFFRALATLIHAGVPLRRALEITIERTPARSLSAILREVLAEVERGSPLSAAFGQRPRIFPPLVVAMIAAGEAGGILDEVLERIASLLERDQALRKSVLAALAYPAVVAVAAALLVLFLIARIVPMFAALFRSFRIELPLPTRVLLWLGDSLTQPWTWIVGVVLCAGLAAGVALTQHSRRGRYLLDRARLQVPVVGGLVRRAILARFARMLATLVHCGFELSAAIEVVAPVTDSAVHATALARVATALRRGETLVPALAAERIFDPMFVALVGVGEESGMLDELLATAADYFEGDVAATIATLGAMLEPALIVVLGLVVGFIVSSVFIPLYTLIGSLNT